MLNASQTLGATAIDYSKQEAELYLTVDSSVYKINIESLSPVEKLELDYDFSTITFDKEFTNLYAITHNGKTRTVRYFIC